MEKRKDFAFGKEVYLLGKDKEGVLYWLEQASWDCDWYWGFGYVENYTNNKQPHLSRDKNGHQHFDGLFLERNIYDSFKELLVETPLTNNEIWQLLELMKTFYTLRKTSELYHLGGSHITTNNIKDLLKNEEEENRINKELLPKLFEEVYKILTPTKEGDNID